MKKHSRFIAWLILFTCVTVLLSCGAGEGSAESEDRLGTPAAIRYTAAPAEAFGDEESARVIAVSGDGSRILISSPFSLYIWDTGSGKRIPVSFPSEEDAELLNMKTERAISLTPGKRSEDQTEKIREIRETYLAKLGLTRFENVDQITECYGRILQIRAVCISMGSRYAVISENTNTLGMFTLDLQTGEARMIDTEQVSLVLPVLCGDRMLTGIGITDLNTGETTVPEFPDPETEPDEEYMTPRPETRLLPDGSVVSIARGAPDKETWELNFYLRKLSAAENVWTLLGKYQMNMADSNLYITGDGKYAAVSPPFYTGQRPVIVSLETLEIREPEAGDLVILGEYDTGFICVSRESMSLLRLDAETFAQTPLRRTGDPWPEMNASVLGSLASNGRNYCCQGAIVRGYFTADGE